MLRGQQLVTGEIVGGGRHHAALGREVSLELPIPAQDSGTKCLITLCWSHLRAWMVPLVVDGWMYRNSFLGLGWEMLRIMSERSYPSSLMSLSAASSPPTIPRTVGRISRVEARPVLTPRAITGGQ